MPNVCTISRYASDGRSVGRRVKYYLNLRHKTNKCVKYVSIAFAIIRVALQTGW